ncbi:MAG: hypothetical protein Q8K92_12195 [Leadbetterella sp.]|nr:hypothetical protein [Leadbetterella sp.]
MSEIIRYGNKAHYRTLSSSFRAPVVGHISKEMWVTQVIAGGELCVIQPARNWWFFN